VHARYRPSCETPPERFAWAVLGRSRGRKYDPPTSGKNPGECNSASLDESQPRRLSSPMAVSGMANMVFSVATLMLPWTDRPTPPPTAAGTCQLRTHVQASHTDYAIEQRHLRYLQRSNGQIQLVLFAEEVVHYGAASPGPHKQKTKKKMDHSRHVRVSTAMLRIVDRSNVPSSTECLAAWL
jgi:hypothetical protein